MEIIMQVAAEEVLTQHQLLHQVALVVAEMEKVTQLEVLLQIMVLQILVVAEVDQDKAVPIHFLKEELVVLVL
jgi:hypothetical protein